MDNRFVARIFSLIILLLSHHNSLANKDSGEEEEAIKLTEINVNADAIHSDSTLKTQRPIEDSPYSVSVLTTDFMKEIGTEKIQDALGYVSGAFGGHFGADTRADWVLVRGMEPVQYLDGLRLSNNRNVNEGRGGSGVPIGFEYNNNSRINPFSLQEIEILKGPSSAVSGQGSFGGILNMISKRPSPHIRGGQLWFQLGSFDRKQIALDYGNRLNSSDTSNYRLITLIRNSEFQMDFVNDDAFLFKPSFDFQIGEKSKLTIIGDISVNDTVASSAYWLPLAGTIWPHPDGRIPVNRFIGEPGFDKYKTEQASITLLFDHDFSNGWTFSGGLRHSDSSTDFRAIRNRIPFYTFDPGFEDFQHIERSIHLSDARSNTTVSDFSMTGVKHWGNTTHFLKYGMSFEDQRFDSDVLDLRDQGGYLNVFINPIYGLLDNLPSLADVENTPANNFYQQGLYFHDQTYWGKRFISSLAIRYDAVRNDPARQGGRSGIKSTKEYNLSGHFGLMFKLDNGLSPYINYTDSFEPLIGVNAYNKPLVPKKGKQYELGLKYIPKNTNHFITLTAFEINEKNRQTLLPEDMIQDPEIVNPYWYIQAEQAKIRGFEIESKFHWKRINLYSTYSYFDSETINIADDSMINGTVPSTPDHSFSTWVSYQPEHHIPGLRLGMGIRYVGHTTDGNLYDQETSATPPVITDDYIYADMRAEYKFKNYEFSLNISNLTDKINISNCRIGNCYYGSRRMITANLVYNF